MGDSEGTLPAPRGDSEPAGVPRLSDDEAAAILKRAADRSLQPNLPAPHDLTLDDLVEVAQEVGLDAGDVRRAAMVRPGAESPTQQALFGGQTGQVVHAAAPVPLPEDREGLQRAAEAMAGRSGRVVKSTADRWIWETAGTLGHARVALRTVDGRTEVEVTRSRSAALALTYVPLLLGVGAASGSLGLFAAVTAAAGPLVSVLGLFGIPLILSRPLFRRGDRDARERTEQLAMELLRVLEAGDTD